MDFEAKLAHLGQTTAKSLDGIDLRQEKGEKDMFKLRYELTD